MVTIVLTEQQAGVLQQLLDMATKSGGLQVAEAALFFAKSINAAVEQSKLVMPPQSAPAAEANAPATPAEVA